MEEKEIMKIKKSGKLVAFESEWQYWLMDGTVYSMRVNGQHYDIWCNIERLGRHLHRLYQISGYKFFTESEDMVIVDAEFLKQFSYA